MSSPLRQQLNEQGFVIVEGLLKEPWLTQLREACARVLERARAGPNDPIRWGYVRAVGKQFPPFPIDRDDIWGVQHLMHPDLHEPIFLEWYTSPLLLATVCEIIGCEEDDLQLELFNLLVNPRQIPFSLGWHRDNVRPEASAEEETQELNKQCYATQWNAALFDDDCLLVVPGSHRRARTPDERRVNLEADGRSAMPNEKRVIVPAGSVLFYDHNILHRATYPTTPQRGTTIHKTVTDLKVTLHGCMSSATHAGPERARVILQHDLEWMVTMKLPEGTEAEKMRDRLVCMAKKSDRKNLGYSLVG